MTPDEKAELRKAAEAATPGPWAYATGCGAQVIAGVVAKDEPGHVVCAKGGWFLFELETDNYFGHVQFDEEEIDEEEACDERAFADSRFIALANPATVIALLDENARLAAEVERMPKWIPCSERMPIVSLQCNLCLAWDGGSVVYAHFDGKQFSDWSDELCRVIAGVTHWMPLPEPPK